MQRRRFFSALLGAPVVAAAAVVPVERERFSDRIKRTPHVTTTLREFLESTFRLMGALAAGEAASAVELRWAHYELRLIDGDTRWAAIGLDDRVTLPAIELRTLRWSLAFEMSRQYRLYLPHDAVQHYFDEFAGPKSKPTSAVIGEHAA